MKTIKEQVLLKSCVFFVGIGCILSNSSFADSSSEPYTREYHMYNMRSINKDLTNADCKAAMIKHNTLLVKESDLTSGVNVETPAWNNQTLVLSQHATVDIMLKGKSVPVTRTAAVLYKKDHSPEEKGVAMLGNYCAADFYITRINPLKSSEVEGYQTPHSQG